ncbi:MAG: hypothetical protein ACKVX7_01420 [Planctomycetota bacterium]
MKTTSWLVLILVSSTLITGSWWARAAVEESVAAYSGAWSFEMGELPPWLPVGFQGQLAQLKEIPQLVPLRSARWRELCTIAMSANPWVERVLALERQGLCVEFEAQLARPVVALRLREHFALVDAERRIIDLQPGFELDPAWGIPYYSPLSAPPRVAPGDRLEHEEFVELLALVQALRGARAFELWSDRLPEVRARLEADGSLLWYLCCSTGMEAAWGRSPGSRRICPLSVSTKIKNLSELMSNWDRLNGVRLVSLYQEPRALVVVR